MGVKLENLPVSSVELDHANPRIRRFLEMYPDPTPEQIFLALGAGGDGSGDGEGSSFDKLRNSILSSGGIVQPIIVNRDASGRLICVEGNTRVAIYRSFIEDEVKGEWSTIPAMVHEGLTEAQMDGIRLQVHLVGPRAWDPYSKAKYLTYLRTRELQPFERIIEFCGGSKRDVQEAIQAYTDMERYYRPLVDEGSFDIRKFSGFVEAQKSKVKEAIFEHGFSMTDFAHWINDERIDPLNSVRKLPAVLRNPSARDTFLRKGMRKAVLLLDRPDPGTNLSQASIGQLARALTEAINKIELVDLKHLRTNPENETVIQVLDALEALEGFVKDELKIGA